MYFIQMYIFIKFCIISTLIGLNSSHFVQIKIDKSGLKSEPKIFEGTDGKFLLKMAKKSENGQWKYGPIGKVTDKNDFAPLIVPTIWNDLDKKKKKGEPQMLELAIKVEMVSNKSVINE